MNAPHTPPVGGTKPHPLLILAALAVILFCLAGIAAIMGWIPSSVGGTAATRQLTEADRLALAASMQQQSTLAAQAQLPAPAASAGLPYQPAQPLPQQAPPQLATGAQYPAQMLAAAPAPVAVREPEPEPLPAPRPVTHAPVHKPVQVAEAKLDRNWCSNCGNIESVRTITHRAQGSGLGAAGGAVLGGLLGNQIGGGSGRQLATVAGAVGGAVVGNQVEGNMKATHSYEIRVRLDDGSQRVFRQSSNPSWRTGDRVRIVNGRLRSALTI
jgi:outer membrane lipoprotein SlyB